MSVSQKAAVETSIIQPDYFSRSGLLAATARYIAHNSLQLLGAVFMPIFLGAIVFYIALDAYLLRLLEIIHAPSESAETLLFGIAAAGFVLGLFAHSVAAAGISANVCGDKPARQYIRFAVTQSDLRLYAASLRLLLVTCLFIALVAAFLKLLRILDIQSDVGTAILRLLTQAVAGVLLVRLGMLLPPVAVREHGSVLRRSFLLTRRRTMGVIIFWFVLLIPGLLVELAGDYVVRHVVGLSLSSSLTLTQSSLMLRAVLPYFIGVLTLSYTITLICLTVGSSLLYRKLTAAGR